MTPFATHPEWQQLALYALGAAVVLTLLFRIPHVGRVLRGAFSLGMLALVLFVLLQQAPYEPNLAPLAGRLGLDGQEVAGEETRIRISADGHFWAQAQVNGVPRRMLIDTGATVTALSEETARLAGVERNASLVPILMRTANGVVRADTAQIDSLALGNIEAHNLKVIISPALGPLDVLGMNFLSQLASWRVEGRTLILAPKAPDQGAQQPVSRTPPTPPRPR